jgi:hypothetical protein
MTFVLERGVSVAVDPKREDYTPNKMEVLPAGTRMSEIDAYAQRQLCPEHFVDGDGTLNEEGHAVAYSDKLPKDWRSADRQAKDDQQKAFIEEHLRTHTHYPEA